MTDLDITKLCAVAHHAENVTTRKPLWRGQTRFRVGVLSKDSNLVNTGK